jgi:hypothetical protein
MAYDLEKYRDKREKVLGVKKRGLSFGVLATIVSGVIILGLAVAVIPQSMAYFNARHLEDAIFKRQGGTAWSRSIMADTQALHGIKRVVTDQGDLRLVVTFDRQATDLSELTAFFKRSGVEAILLNRISHLQNLSIQREEKEREAQ